MENNTSNSSSSWKSMFTFVVIIAAFIVSWLIFHFVMGDKSHFMDNDPTKNPKLGDYLGTIYKGGMLVPVLMTLLLMVIAFSIERFLTITASRGKGNANDFLRKVKSLLAAGNIDAAIAECDKQRGSIGNVVRNGLVRYKQVQNDSSMSKDEKQAAIQKELEESTSLELPMLEKNLVILATVASIATLMGLLGTVLGMIRAFAALANAGAPDAVALSTGISEALINTAFGIGTSALAIVLYNTFTTSIDGITYSIDEAGFSIAQTFASTHQVNSAKTTVNA
jgi:biopolymer transport protein ExbB